jgi:hypothetical protein
MSKTPSPNIYGIETEYSCMLTFPSDEVYEIVGSCHSEDAKLGLYVEPEDKGMSHVSLTKVHEALEEMGIYPSDSGMLSNGGRLYVDPSGPEYCTPETTSAEEAVLRTFEGDQIVSGIFESLRKKELIKSYQLNRRIVDHNRSSRGIHLNTLTELEQSPSKEQILLLATLNVAKGALFGSGGLLVNKKGNTEYHHSPRLSLTDMVDSDYYKKRPLVRQPFKGDVDCSRIETISGDALNFGWPLKASMIATNALVAMIETGRANELPSLRYTQAIDSALNVGKHGYKGRMVMLRETTESNERSIRVLTEICETILKSDDRSLFLDTESRTTLEQIIEVADTVSRNPIFAKNNVESIARYEVLKRRMQSKGVDLNSEAICRADYGWDLIGGGYAEVLRNRHGYGWLGFAQQPKEKATAKRLQTPPSDTRAKLRGEKIKEKIPQGLSDNST